MWQRRVATASTVVALVAACGSGATTATPPDPGGDGSVATTLECDGSEQVRWAGSIAADAAGSDEEPAAIVEQWLGDQLGASDELHVVTAGTETADGPTLVALVRDEATVAIIELLDAPRGGLLVTGYEACVGVLEG